MTNTRAALFVATQARLDGKTRNRVACKPPNKKCGNRCIPPDWDCRLNGEGGDGHLRAAGKGSDPLSGLANAQRGLGRLRKGILTGNFSDLEGGRRAVIRGAVKASPQDLKEKKELQAKLVQGTIGIGIALAVLGGGVRAHGILSNIRVYREGIGKKIDDSVGNALNTVLDIHPGRARNKSEARAAVAELVGRRNGLGAIGPGMRRLPDTSDILRRTPVDFNPNTDLSRRVRAVDPADYNSDFGAWHQASYKTMWTSPRLAEQKYYEELKNKKGYYFATLAGEDFLRNQYKITGGAEVGGRDLVEQIVGKLDAEHKSIAAFAKDRGFALSKVEERQRFTTFMLNDQKLTGKAREEAQIQLMRMTHPEFARVRAARNIYTRTVSSFDNFYESLAEDLPKVYDSNGLRRSVAVAQYPVMQTAMQGHAEFNATRLYPTAGRQAVKGPYSADLVNHHYFQAGGRAAAITRSWSAPRLTIQKAAEEHAGRPVKDLGEAVTILRGTGAFEGLVVASTAPIPRARPSVAPRNMRRVPFKFETPEEEQSFSRIVEGFVDRKRPDGKPLYKTRAAAEAAARAEIQKRRAERSKKRSDAYYEAFNAVRADKRCGKSGIPDNRNCSKKTLAAQAASSGGGQSTAAPKDGDTLKKVAIGAGAVAATAVALTLGVKSQQVMAYRKNVSRSAIDAEAMAKDMVREFNEKAAKRLGKDVKDVTPFEASTYNFKDKGYDTGFGSMDNTPAFYGQTQNSKGAVVMLSYADDGNFTRRGQGSQKMAERGAFQEIWGEHDILPFANRISQPSITAPDDLELKSRKKLLKGLPQPAKLPIKTGIDMKNSAKRMGYLQDNIGKRGFNPDAVRAAAFVVAQRRLTGKPVHLLAYSNGGNVASETLAILSEMGYKDVRAINIAGPTFGIFKHSDENMRTWVSKGDMFYGAMGKRAFASSPVRELNNNNIPHGLQEYTHPSNPDWKKQFKAGNSYLLDKQLQEEAYTYLTVDRQRSRELTNEMVWRVAEGKTMEGDLKNLFGDKSDEVMSRYNKAFVQNRVKAKEDFRAEVEQRMIDAWYGGYDPKKVKRAQKALRVEVQKNATGSQAKADSADRTVFLHTAALAKARSLQEVG